MTFTTTSNSRNCPVIIDIHSHYYPVSYLEFLRQRQDPPNIVKRDGDERLLMYPDQAASATPKGAKLSPEYFDIQAKLRYMDEHGVDGALISLGNPWIDFLTGEEAGQKSATINDELISACQQASDRLWALACIPVGDIDASLVEMRRVSKKPQVVGVLTGTRIAGVWPDELAAEPFWSLAEELNLPVFIHPFYGTGDGSIAAYNDMLRFALEFPFETALTFARLITSGILDRHPNLKLVMAHAGGPLPALIGRLDAYCGKSYQQGLQNPIQSYLSHFYFDAITYSPIVLRMVAEQVGVDQLMYGTDHPFSAANPRLLADTVRQANFTVTEQETIFSHNARKLFGLPASVD